MRWNSRVNSLFKSRFRSHRCRCCLSSLTEELKNTHVQSTSGNSNLPLTRSNFHYPLDRFLYNFTLDNSNFFPFPLKVRIIGSWKWYDIRLSLGLHFKRVSVDLKNMYRKSCIKPPLLNKPPPSFQVKKVSPPSPPPNYSSLINDRLY